MFKFLNRSIWLLSLVSLFADMASEMLYPVMPAFLEEIGFTALSIGFLEGAAAMVAGFGKAYFGALSDQLQRRNLFVRLGYGISGIAKPMMGLFPYSWPVFGTRLADRVGKGMRGASRDALLSQASKPEDRGKVFGFHRSMDTIGAVVGPLLALAWMQNGQHDLAQLFILAIIPGIISVVLTLLLEKEPKRSKGEKPVLRPFKGIFSFWKTSSQGYKRLLVAAIAFALLNSTDMLLLLKARESGASLESVIGMYVFFNLVYVLASFPLGGLADKIGFKFVYVLSIAVYGLCYLAMGLATESWMLWLIFGLYGVYSAANEGIAKAWLSKLVPKEQKATGMGLYSFLETLAQFCASPLTGLLWLSLSASLAFSITGAAAILFSLLFIFILPAKNKLESSH